MEQYTLRYDGGSYIGKTPICDQARGAAKGYARSTGLSVVVTRYGSDVREVVFHPDGTYTRLWAGER